MVLSDLNGNEMQSRRRRRARSSFDERSSSSNNNNKNKISYNEKIVIKDSTVTLNVKRHVVSDQVAPSNGVKPSLKKKKKKKTSCSQVVETEAAQDHCTSEDSSPVSVLDCGQFLIDPEVSISGKLHIFQPQVELKVPL